MSLSTLPVPPGIDPATARLALAIGLFQEEKVSVGQAATIAGLSYRAFLDGLRERGIPAFVYDDEALEEDLAFVRRFKRTARSPSAGSPGDGDGGRPPCREGYRTDSHRPARPR